MRYMATCIINIPQMLAYIPYMDPMGLVGHLLQTAIPEALITLVILTSLMNIEGPVGPAFQPEYQVLDFYAGAARVARASRQLGEVSASFDISYHSNPRVFDINSPSGMVSLCSILQKRIVLTYRTTQFVKAY